MNENTPAAFRMKVLATDSKVDDRTFNGKCVEMSRMAVSVCMSIHIDGKDYRVINFEPNGAKYMRVRVMDTHNTVLTLDLPRTFPLKLRMEI